MSIIAKIFNFKSTVKYHQFMVFFTYRKAVAILLFQKYVMGKKVKIIILPEHIGDIIAFTPFAKMLKNEQPKSYIVWLGKPTYLPIIENNKNINYCLPIFCDGVTERFSKNNIFEVYDVRFNGNNYCPICQTKRKYQKIDESFNLDNYYEYGSLLEIFSKLAGKPMAKESAFPEISISESTKIKIKNLKLPQKYICIHTTSNDTNREWLYEKWRKLISEIIKIHNLEIVQIGLTDYLKISDPKFSDLTGKLSLIETAEVIKNCSLFIGIDSGPAHMANAFGVKSVILLGKYREITNYMPFSGNFANGFHSKIIYNSKIKCSEIEVDQVLSQVNSLLAIHD